MKKTYGFIVAAIAATLSTGALAADLPRAYPTKAHAVQPSFNWSGMYVGVHGGYGWADADGAGAIGAADIDGGLIGAQLGWNWQASGSPWVFGVELDSAWANLEGSSGVLTSETDYIGSLRGRVGYAFDRSLIYATGGLGWAHNEISTPVGTDDNTHVGYVLGAGLEYAFNGPWSAKAEYLYYGLDAETYGIGAGISSGDVDVQTIKLGLNYRFGAW